MPAGPFSHRRGAAADDVDKHLQKSGVEGILSCQGDMHTIFFFLGSLDELLISCSE